MTPTTTKPHSPFHVIENFMSPTTCEKLIKSLGVAAPTLEIDGETPIKNERFLADTEFDTILRSALSDHADDIEDRYGAVITGIDRPLFIQHFENPKKAAVPHGCESAKFMRRAWVKTKDVDVVAYVWLKDYNSGVPLDPRFEVYGGKLEFPAHNFSVLPKRGTCVVFPAGPHFITAVSHVFVGSCEYVKFALKLQINTETGEVAWHYNPQNFPGTYVDWFKQ